LLQLGEKASVAASGSLVKRNMEQALAFRGYFQSPSVSVNFGKRFLRDSIRLQESSVVVSSPDNLRFGKSVSRSDTISD
jgi:hypothetical protein